MHHSQPPHRLPPHPAAADLSAGSTWWWAYGGGRGEPKEDQRDREEEEKGGPSESGSDEDADGSGSDDARRRRIPSKPSIAGFICCGNTRTTSPTLGLEALSSEADAAMSRLTPSSRDADNLDLVQVQHP
jgi:hypothetical protein